MQTAQRSGAIPIIHNEIRQVLQQCYREVGRIPRRARHISTQGRRLTTAAAPTDFSDHSYGPGISSTAAQSRFNEIGVQQISRSIHKQLFAKQQPPPPTELINLSRDHLRTHNLLGRNQTGDPAISFELPQVYGQSLDEHFHRLGAEAAEPYLSYAKQFAKSELPKRPRKWVRRSGWTRYTIDGEPEPISAPLEPLLTFDTEVMWKESSFAVMACAASPSAWYAWLSPWLLGETENDEQLVPLGDPTIPRIIVGHNIGYDRARVAEEYSVSQSSNGFIDTMSLHVAVNGMCSQQRPTWMKHRKNKELREKIANGTESPELATLMESNILNEGEEELWVGRSSVNSLRDVAKFHCNIVIDKAQRDAFGELDRSGILGKLDELLDYCAADVDVTHRVYKKVLPGFLEVAPHPVSFAALRHLSSVYLPVDEHWDAYLQNAEATYQKLMNDVQDRLNVLANIALDSKQEPVEYMNDPWLNQLDWSGQEVRMTKPKKKGEEPRPAAKQKKPGMPVWYKDLFATNSAAINLTVRTRVAPILLKLSWDGHPLVWSDKYGWTFRVRDSEAAKYQDGPLVRCNMIDEKNLRLRDDLDHTYFKLPHKDGPTARCSSPLAKGYGQYFENGTLSSAFSLAKEALDMNSSCSYWMSARDRIMSQMAVFPNAADGQGKRQGAILPQVIPMGTITRRAVENTWLTASNAKSNRVGSELKAMVRAPPGYCFVGADVDSEELWIASLVGDAQFGLHGGNAIGFMTLEGTKAEGTDLHSNTAKIIGTSRNDAKIFNYGRIYGAGLKFASTLLRQFNPSLSDKDTNALATRLYKETKGQKTNRKMLAEHSFWRGGTESLVFNKLEEFAEQERPRTPVLAAGITEALMRRFINKGAFMTSRINWAIQSSGVDYLHLLIISMDHLIRRFNLQARLSITVHDEIRYLVKEEDKYRAAMALQVANLWTRAMFCQQMGIDDVPQACAFFSAVDIDKVLRKEVDMDCITPSNSVPIPHGESLTIGQLLAKQEQPLLDSSITPNNLDISALQAVPYEPRVPVMAQLNKSSPTTLAYLKAQITSDDGVLRDIIKDLKKSEMAGKPLKLKAITDKNWDGRQYIELPTIFESYRMNEAAEKRQKIVEPWNVGRGLVNRYTVRA